MFDAIVLWLHILGAVVFIGPQVFLAAIAVPALRGVGDARLRQDLLRKMTRGFGWLGGGALALAIVTGLWNLKVAQDNQNFDATRFFWTFNIKMVLVIAVVALTAAHGAVFGRRMQQLQEQGAPEEEVAEVRRWSMTASMATLALSVAILLLAAILGSNWALEGGRR